MDEFMNVVKAALEGFVADFLAQLQAHINDVLAPINEKFGIELL